MRRIPSTSELFATAPEPGTIVKAQSYYLSSEGGQLVSTHGVQSEIDKPDCVITRTSEDNGRTWSSPVAHIPIRSHPNGTHRTGSERIYPDPGTGRILFLWVEGVLPTDNPLENNLQMMPYFAVSNDGGRTRSHSGPLICEGTEFDGNHPVPGITRGKAGLSFAERGTRPITRKDGVIVVPVHVAHLGPDEVYHNPGGGYTFSDCMALLGTWQPDGSLAWNASQRVVGDPLLSTRGFVEPTIAVLSDASILMVMRGSNDVRTELPGHKWQVRSTDGGLTWDAPRPWTYDDGEAFHSPSACSQLLPWSDGRIFWIGNICDTNPKGNNPRHPLVLGEVDPGTGCLLRSTVGIIDDLRPEDDGRVGLSNFYGREDRESGELVLHLTRSCPGGRWEGEALLFRIAVH